MPSSNGPAAVHGGRGGQSDRNGRGGRGMGRAASCMAIVYYPGHHGECFKSKVTTVLPVAASTGRVWSCVEADGGCGLNDSEWLLSGTMMAAPEEPEGVPDYEDVPTASMYSVVNTGFGGNSTHVVARRDGTLDADPLNESVIAGAGRLG